MSNAKARLKAAIRRAARMVPRKSRPAILMYHRIGRETFDPWGLAVEAERFAAQIEWLAGNRTVFPLTEFARLHRERQLPGDAVSLTFDDGYASVLEAVPLLQKSGLHATVFLPAELVERRVPFWWDELAEIVLAAPPGPLQLDGELLSIPPAHERDRLWEPESPPRTPRQRVFLTLWSRLHAKAPAALGAAMAQLRKQVPGAEPGPTHRLLTLEQTRSVDAGTIAFGSHGLSHPSLPALSQDEKLHEIRDSRARCSALTGTAPVTFAYPYGELDDSSIGLIEQAGYACACAAGDAFVNARSNLFALPRLRAGNWDPGRLRDMLGG